MRSSSPPSPDQFALPLPGLTCDLHTAMRWRADDRCEICRVRAEEVQQRPLHVDHDHRLGTGWNHIRGLLCSRCNNHMKYVDNGHWKPTPEQLRYIENAWFWVLLPPDQIDQPYFPPSPKYPTWSAPYDETPTCKRRCAAIAKAKAEKRKLRRTRAGGLIWWEKPSRGQLVR